MASFFASDPVPLIDGFVEEGFVLYGGQDLVGAVLNDLWLFDL